VIEVRARRSFEFEGRQVTAGEMLRNVDPVAAAVLHRQGKITLTRLSPAKVAALEAESPKRARGRGRRPGTYKRRDVVTKPS